MNYFKRILACIFFWVFELFLSNNFCYAKHDIPHIRIRLGESLKSIAVKGMDLTRELYLEKSTKYHQGNKTVKFNCQFPKKEDLDRGKLEFLQSKFLAKLNSPSGVLSWNSEKYRGELYVSAQENLDGCSLIHQVSLEDYLSTLLAKEMNPYWPIEALKAQAVAARSYALFHMENNKKVKNNKKIFYDLENSEKDQVSGSLADETAATRKATLETKGQILVTKGLGKITPIFFHSKCGGKTLQPEYVWDKKVDGYKMVDCPYCKHHGITSWEFVISKVEFQSLIKKFRPIKSRGLEKEKLSETSLKQAVLLPDRNDNLYIKIKNNKDTDLFKKSYLRRFLGRNKIKSNLFYLAETNSDIIIKGEGNGHGVGMCQFGALEMADKGWSYQQILSFYYPNHQLKEVY